MIKNLSFETWGNCHCSPGQSSMMPNLTAEVFVPRLVIPALCGEDGGCLDKIREVCIQPVFLQHCPIASVIGMPDLFNLRAVFGS